MGNIFFVHGRYFCAGLHSHDIFTESKIFNMNYCSMAVLPDATEENIESAAVNLSLI